MPVPSAGSPWSFARSWLGALAAAGPEEAAALVLKEACRAFESPAGLVLASRDGKLEPLAQLGLSLPRLKELSLPADQGFAAWVLDKRRPLRISHAAKDPGLLLDIDKATGLKTRSAAAAPVLSGPRGLGAIVVFNAPKSNRFPLEGLCFAADVLAAAWDRPAAGGGDFTRGVLDALPAGIMAVDLAGRLLGANLRAEQILRIVLRGREGEPVKELVKEREGFLEAVQAVMRSSKPVTRQSVVINLEGDPRTMGFSGGPILGPGGLPAGFTLLFQDISAFVSV